MLKASAKQPPGPSKKRTKRVTAPEFLSEYRNWKPPKGPPASELLANWKPRWLREDKDQVPLLARHHRRLAARRVKWREYENGWKIKAGDEWREFWGDTDVVGKLIEGDPAETKASEEAGEKPDEMMSREEASEKLAEMMARGDAIAVRRRADNTEFYKAQSTLNYILATSIDLLWNPAENTPDHIRAALRDFAWCCYWLLEESDLDREIARGEAIAAFKDLGIPGNAAKLINHALTEAWEEGGADRARWAKERLKSVG